MRLIRSTALVAVLLVSSPVANALADPGKRGRGKSKSSGPARAEAGMVASEVEGVYRVASPEGDVYVVVLQTLATPRAKLPIYIGESEAFAIRMRMGGWTAPRPMTHDLLEQVLRRLKGRILKIYVEDLQDKTFLGRIFVQQGAAVIELDARPSDSIALAVGAGAPIYVARSVMDAAGSRPHAPGRPL